MQYHRRRAGVLLHALPLATLILLLLLTAAGGDSRALRVVAASGKLVGLYQASYALIIGVSDYTNGWPTLPGVKDDVAAVRQVLAEQGFAVTMVYNPTAQELHAAFDAFIKQYGFIPEHRLLIYFAGHGHTIKQSYGEEIGYLVPVDAPNPQQDKNGFLATALDMQQIEVYAKRMQAKHVLFLFDSCFSGALFSLSRAVPEHISYKTSQPVRQFITAGRADEKVPDESIFRRQFQAALRGEADTDGDGYVTGTELGEFLTNKVINYSKNSQHPQYGKIRNPNLDKGDFVFKITITILPDEATEKALQADENKRVQEQRQREAEASPPARRAERRPASAPEAETPPPKATATRPSTEIQVTIGISPDHSKTPEPPARTLRNSIGMEFVLIPAGEFSMGVYDGLPYEQPVHKVIITQPFYLGKYEVTQAQWVEVMGSNPSYFVANQGDSNGLTHAAKEVEGFFKRLGGAAETAGAPKVDVQRPVERVSWYQAQEFLRRLNAKEGHDKYRLPSEAEWEYAARAGAATHYSFGDNDWQLEQHGWYIQNAAGKTQAVGLLKPNAWGLYDMQGNVLEWVLDWWAPRYPSGPVTNPEGPPTGTLKVLRGGSWANAARQCWISGRLYNAPSVPHVTYGFRVLRTAP